MSIKAATVRDPFAFSLRGATSVNGISIVPVIRDDAPRCAPEAQHQNELRRSSNIILAFEDFLARYLAPGCCHS